MMKLIGVDKLLDPCNAPPVGYGDTTSTYIRRAKIPSHMYAKYQYMQKSEYESTVMIYIPINGAQIHSYHVAWSNITWILHHKRRRIQITKIRTIQNDAQELTKKGITWAGQEETGREKATTDPLALPGKPVIHGRVLNAYVACSGIWACKFRSCQKITQWVREMKPSGVHKQSHVYKIKV